MKQLRHFMVSPVGIMLLAMLVASAIAPEAVASAAPALGLLGAVVNTKSTPITNLDSTPQKLVALTSKGGKSREDVGTLEGANGDSIGSTFRLVRVPSNARISRILLSNDAIATTGAADIGVYRTAADGGAVVDADFFASAVVLTAAQVNVDVTHEADAADAGAGFGLQDVEKPLWQALGLAADPNVDYDIVATLTAALGGAGTVSLKAQYIGGSS